MCGTTTYDQGLIGGPALRVGWRGLAGHEARLFGRSSSQSRLESASPYIQCRRKRNTCRVIVRDRLIDDYEFWCS